MSIITRAITIFLLAAVFASCAPRGESHNVKEVLQIQSSRFTDARGGVTLTPQVEESLGKIDAQLKSIAVGENVGAVGPATVEIANQLTFLITHAGYTTRPALSEIAAQYRVISQTGPNSPASVKLLAARTYSVLTAELLGTKFALS